MTDEATNRQIVAADPHRSTWLSANAGSGKTSVLTNRVARLLLRGADPRNILCLTYTKAAASEMQNRLFKTLGNWAMLEDEELQAALSDLGEGSVNDLSRARTLFARAIDTPGGLKIQTIHSLCGSILRQFPLEAGVSPHFREIDAPQQREVIETVLEKLALDHPDLVQSVSEFYSDDLSKLALDVAGKAEDFRKPRSKAEIFRSFGISPSQTEEQIARSALTADDIAFLKSLVPILRQNGSKNDHKMADAFDALDQNPSRAFTPLRSLFITAGRKLRSNQPTGAVCESSGFAPLLPNFELIRRRTEDAMHQLFALRAAQQAVAIQSFAQAFLPAYKQAKQAGGYLDFDDLIEGTRKLLTSQSQQWVMYRLDGKIDHILVDEAQDTSPKQWDVIEALAEEMASGETDRPRTLFVVGDKKQSIYSFQGADAAGFDSRAERFRERLSGGQGLRPASLEYSFRSSPAILNVVDEVFNEGQISGLGAEHQAYQATLPGRVDLWPLVPTPDKVDEPKWSETGNRIVENKASFDLADAVAQEIASMIGNVTIPSKNGPKLVDSGDIMVLVQRRGAVFHQIIQACKALGLDIAGADVLKLSSELAVRDLLALLSFLAMPDDCLSLASTLRSPLFGWSERDLYDLAAKRPKGTKLWAALRREKRFAETYETLAELRKKVDFARPYELLELILTRYHGRSRLLARLGPEAEDGIDALLNQALAHEQDAIPSLTSFVSSANAAEIEVKRQSETTGNKIRVMTVHGAKGLESPIVILPDTTAEGNNQNRDLLEVNGCLGYPTRDADAPTVTLEAKQRKKNADQQERNRLLYVAMTRAEKWLIVCGVTPRSRKVPHWHETVEAGLQRAGAQPTETPFGEGLRYQHGIWPDEPESPCLETKKVSLIETFAFGRAQPIPETPKTIAPSDLPGAKALGGEGRSEEDAKRHGRRIHLLLEHLPGVEDGESLARSLLSGGPDAAKPDEIPALFAEARKTLEAHPAIFAPDALTEVGIVADVPALNARMSGMIDRLLISDDRILAVDFKTNAVVPETAADTPDGILRQMGAYLEGLEAIYPDHEIELAILWTSDASLMRLEHGIVRDALRQTPTS